LRFYFADLKAGLVDRLLADLSTERTGLHAQLTDLATRLKDLRSRERSLDIELAGHGGNRLTEIDRLLEENEAATRDRMDRAERFGKLLAEAGLDPVETAEHSAARRREIAAARDRAKADLADAQNRLTDAGYAAKALEDKAAVVNAELVSLREHGDVQTLLGGIANRAERAEADRAEAAATLAEPACCRRPGTRRGRRRIRATRRRTRPASRSAR